MKKSAYFFGILSAVLVGMALSNHLLGAGRGSFIIRILCALLSALGIGASFHTFGRVNKVDKPAFENMGYSWPSSLVLWIGFIAGFILSYSVTPRMSGLGHLVAGLGVYAVWFLLTYLSVKLRLVPDREEAHLQFYGTDAHL